MISKRLTRRVEDLESHILTAAGEPSVIRLDFVDAAGTAVDHQDFIVNAPAPRHRRARPWWRK